MSATRLPGGLEVGKADGWAVQPDGLGFRWSAFSGANTRSDWAPTRAAAEFKARNALAELKAKPPAAK